MHVFRFALLLRLCVALECEFCDDVNSSATGSAVEDAGPERSVWVDLLLIFLLLCFLLLFVLFITVICCAVIISPESTTKPLSGFLDAWQMNPDRGESRRPVDQQARAVDAPLRVSGRIVGQSSAQSSHRSEGGERA